MGSKEEEADNAVRRKEELEAVAAVYGDSMVEIVDADTFWKITIVPKFLLALSFPSSYPSKTPPAVRIEAPSHVFNKDCAAVLIDELKELWTPDTETAILWAEHCRFAIEQNNQQPEESLLRNTEETSDNDERDNNQTSQSRQQLSDDAVRVFVPASSKFGQPTRQFQESVIDNDANRRVIHRGNPFHPPKSGPAETMLAHVASVETMDHVDWVLAEIMFQDKKVAKASHNMIAYRFFDKERGCLVSDNDDDGEKGSGSKLAALLELSDVENVLVMVSRWYGGVHLGPARFKHIANTARETLKENGFLKSNDKR